MLKNNDLKVKPVVTFKEKSYGQIVVGIILFSLATCIFRYICVYDKEISNLKGATFVYILLCLFCLAIVLYAETRVLELNNQKRTLSYCIKRILGGEETFSVMFRYEDIEKVKICQKLKNKGYTIEVSYYLKLNMYQSLDIARKLKLFRTSSLFHIKKHYYLLNYILDKELEPDDTKIDLEKVECTKKTQKLTKVN